MAVNTEVKTYQAFRGADYSASPAVISEEHAQDMLNMYIGTDGVMQKRPGWHVMHTFYNALDFSTSRTVHVGEYVKYNGEYYLCDTEHTGTWYPGHFTKKMPPKLPINGIHYLSTGAEKGFLFIHAGTKLYSFLFAPFLRHFDGLNGDVPFFRSSGDKPSVSHVQLIQDYLNGSGSFAAWQVRNMDINKDGKVTEEDRRALVSFTVGPGSSNPSNGVIDESYIICRDTSVPFNYDIMANSKSVSFEHDGTLYILDGEHYYKVVPSTADFYVESVEGYIPTTGVNGHYEYLEPQEETDSGESIVEKATETVASGQHSVAFPASKELKDERIFVSLIINQRSVCNGLLLEPTTNTVEIGNATLTYSSGSVTVTTTTPQLKYKDKVTLLIKNEDTSVTVAGEPGSETNPGEWKAPTSDEDRNLLQTKQINTFSSDGIHKAYYLNTNGCDINKVELLLWTRCKSVDGVDTPTQENIDHVDAGTYDGIYYYYKYLWTEVASDDATYGWTARDADSTTKIQNEISYTTRIAFTNRVEVNKDGKPNIRVTFTPRKHSTAWAINKDRSYIEKCSIVTRFGYFNDNRYWFAGNPEHRNMDFMSAVDDPTYFPNTGWTKIGSEQTPIQGYLHYGSELAILKEDNNQDATVYMRSAVYTEDGKILFPVQQGAQGVGALSKWCLKTLSDEPMFLAREGVYAIQGTDASQERTIPSRSHFINRKLKLEASSGCVAEVFKDYYILANPITGHCFVADARYQGLPPGTNDRYRCYEWYLWDNIPASVMKATDNHLFFGTQDGKLCLFNTDWDDVKRYTDGAEFVSGSTNWEKSAPYDDGQPINAYYVTKRDHLGSLDFKKTMLNDGGVIILKPHEQSSASITVTTDKGTWFVDHIQTDSDEPSVVIQIRRRFKNFDSIETRIENKENKEGLSIIGLQYRYVITTNRR